MYPIFRVYPEYTSSISRVFTAVALRAEILRVLASMSNIYGRNAASSGSIRPKRRPHWSRDGWLTTASTGSTRSVKTPIQRLKVIRTAVQQ